MKQETLIPPDITVVSVIDRTSQRAGEFSDVYRGHVTVHEGCKSDQVCAVKVFRGLPSYNTTAVDAFKETLANETQRLKQLQNDNVLGLIGLDCTHSHLPALVTEYCENGNILEYLGKQSRMTEKEDLRWKLIIDALRGLEFLHKNDTVHGDLRASNILVKGDRTACIADCGQVFLFDRTEFTSSKIVGPARWSAPEILNGDNEIDESEPGSISQEPYSTKSDVYAMAMTIQEVVTETPPFSDIRNEAVVVMRVVRGDRPELAPTLSQSPNMKKLISDCWSENRDSRPTAGYMLSEVEKEYPRGGYTSGYSFLGPVSALFQKVAKAVKVQDWGTSTRT